MYNQVKHVFGREKYLNDIDSFETRKLITKFRTSDHKLEIEVGRHKGTINDKRFCKFCPTEIETESHFLSKCPIYKNIRENLFGSEIIEIYFERNILACKTKSLTLKLGNYIKKALKLRESVIDAINEHERMTKYILERGYVIVD